MDVISFSTANKACEKGGQWQRALLLFEITFTEGIGVNVIMLSAAISACVKGG